LAPSWLGGILALVACSRDSGPPFDVGWMTERLTAAGYRGTGTSMPPALGEVAAHEGVSGISCIEALKGPSADVFCVIRCNDSSVCDALVHRTGENYGDSQRGPTILVHNQCAIDRADGTAHCAEARRAISAFGER
jgi:hypothetical protein